MLTNKQLFAQALCDALSSQYDEDLANCIETDKCSADHYKKMSKILGFNVAPKTRAKALSLKAKILVAALVAAALLLAGCAAVIFGDEISCLVEKVFDVFVFAAYDEERDGNGASITEYYELTYITEGYVPIQKKTTPIRTFYKYQNGSNKIITFEQNLYNETGYRFDNEGGYTKALEVNGLDIYHRTYTEYNQYVWNMGSYTFRISSTQAIPNNELEKIVEGILSQK